MPTPESVDGHTSFAALAFSPMVRGRAMRVALVVGLLLALINYGDKLIDMSLTSRDLLKLLLTFLVPYGVSTWSAVQAIRSSSAAR